METRFVSVHFSYLKTDWFIRRQPSLKDSVFVLASPDHGRMVITAVSVRAMMRGIYVGMAVADAKALVPGIEVLPDDTALAKKLLTHIAQWCIRFTPVVSIDLPGSLLLDVSGCTHLWGGDGPYLRSLLIRLRAFGYHVQAAMADTIGAASAVCHYTGKPVIIPPLGQKDALLPLPVAALRLDDALVARLEKLGLKRIADILPIPYKTLKRRFGEQLVIRIMTALGTLSEQLLPVQPITVMQERLPCVEPVATATGIKIALEQLLDSVCKRLVQEEKGLRKAVFNCFRIDGKLEHVAIGTNRASRNVKHLFKLFEEHICSIEPALGIELFTLEVTVIEAVSATQEKIWEGTTGLESNVVTEFIDRVQSRLGKNCVQRYAPLEHHWPERAFGEAPTLHEKLTVNWQLDRPRPIYLLPVPAPVQVAAPIPDYPPMLFRYQNEVHHIKKAEGPERIEQEWWLGEGRHRDYYYVEDDAGKRYWLFRSGHYGETGEHQWFLHGFFA